MKSFVLLLSVAVPQKDFIEQIVQDDTILLNSQKQIVQNLLQVYKNKHIKLASNYKSANTMSIQKNRE